MGEGERVLKRGAELFGEIRVDLKLVGRGGMESDMPREKTRVN